MAWHVSPVGVISSEHVPQCVLVGFDEELTLAMAVGANWGQAAEELVKQLPAAKLVTVDASFHRSVQDVALIRSWTPKVTDETQELLRAMVGFSLANNLTPELHDIMLSLLEAWVAFYRARLWEALSSEVAVRVNAPHSPQAAVAVLGSSGIEHGVAFYDDLSMLQAIMSGEPAEISGASMLAAEPDAFPAMAFEGLGVPPPLVMRVLASRPAPPREYELQLLDASLRILLGWPQDVLELVIEEERPAPRKKAAKKKKPAAAKKKSKPAAKKKKPAAGPKKKKAAAKKKR